MLMHQHLAAFAALQNTKLESTTMQAPGISHAVSLCALIALAMLSSSCSRSERAVDHDEGHAGSNAWIGAWGTAPYAAYPVGVFSSEVPVADPTALTSPLLFVEGQAVDQTFRMVVHPTIGGERLRVRLSNLMGDRPIVVDPVFVALRLAGPSIVADSSTAVLFDGKTAATIPVGAEIVSDAVEFGFSAGEDLAISLHVVGEGGPSTWHPVSFALNYVGLPRAGDFTTDPLGTTTLQPSLGWFFVNGIDVQLPAALGTIVAIGDSITDGAYAVPETNTRWPDWLARRLQSADIRMGVINAGINSNTVLPNDDDSGATGPPAIERFERDVLNRPGVRSVVIMEGTNDLTRGVQAQDIYAGLLSMARRARARGLCVVIGTIPPRYSLVGIATGLNAWDRGAKEAQRQALNALLRESAEFDAVADFDFALRDPLDPQAMNTLLAFPDGLHPNPLGFSVMADAVPLDALVPAPAGHCGTP